MSPLATLHVVIDNQTPTLLLALGVVAAVVSAVAVSIAAVQSRKAAAASLDAGRDAREALAVGIRPHLAVRTAFHVEAGAQTGKFYLELRNPSGWAATDLLVEVRHRDGHVDSERRDRFDPSRRPDGTYEPLWDVPLRAVGKSRSGQEPWGNARELIDSVVVTYSDSEGIARYELRMAATTQPGQMPFAGETGQEHRIR